MGAGTLDLTYLSITKQDDDLKEVSIIAKIGLNKAGNYLDYVLTEALIDTHQDIFPRSFLSPSTDTALLILAGKLKHFIKNELKPNLFIQDNMVFSSLNGENVDIDGKDRTFDDDNIDLSKIREHKLVQQFIKDCTETLLNNFFTTNGCIKGMTPIDTIIMAGRSVQFGDGNEGIESSLMQSIYEWNGGDQNCFKVKIEGDELKTIVSNGALYFATLYSNEGSIVKIKNKNIYASYGVIYTDIKGKTAYSELLTPNTRPTKEPIGESNSTNGVLIYEYDSDTYRADGGQRGTLLDLRNSPVAYFVQSYSINPEADWDSGNREFISVMREFSPQGVVANPSVDLKNVPVRVVVNSHNEMIFYAGIMQDAATAPLVIDIQGNESFRRSMWPYL